MALRNKPRSKRKKLNLALQGGGAHGAYAWGVLDALLEDERIELDGICATSAGTINAMAVAHGLMKGGPEQARAVLHQVWEKISRVGDLYSPIKFMPWEKWYKRYYQDAFMYSAFEFFTNALSPYQFNPFNIHPLRTIVQNSIDVEAVRRCDKVKLFITTTDVYSGQPHVYQNEEVTMDVILASACLPFLYQAVMINGRPHWDGGYTGNPALWPLFYNTDTDDLCVIHINPIERKSIPKESYDITNRMNEITFNASLVSEMRAIAFVQKLKKEKWLKKEYEDRLRYIRLHGIRADKDLQQYSVASKFNTDWSFLTILRDQGRLAAQKWLEENYDAIGQKGTIDIQSQFLNKMYPKQSIQEPVQKRKAAR